MNFLAHAYLSGKNELILIGNFIGDSVKGNELSRFPKEIQDGIRLHRFIDMYTDQHPIFIQSKKRFSVIHKKYAGVVADIAYDHFLALHWQKYSNIPLKQFTKNVYLSLFNHFLILPNRSKRLLPFMMTSDWLSSYSTFDGLQKRLNGMASRAQFESKMELAVQTLKSDYSLYEDEFFLFWKEIQKEIKNNFNY